MDRRTLLRGAVPLLAGAVAGCLGGSDDGSGGDDGDGNGGDGGSPTDPSPASDPSPTATPSQTDAPGEWRLVDRSFRVQDAGCGTDRDEATATADGSRVTVSGTITGSDTCHMARLAGVTCEGSGGRLRVEVASYLPESTETKFCAECLTKIDYEATFTFEGGRPGTVVVVHDGTDVASIPIDD